MESLSLTTVRRAVDHVFVLWGEHFSESSAVLFVTMLREAGLCVKLIGLHGPQATGQSRILIQADLSVTAALDLADRVCAIVMPCSQAALQRSSNDPRIHQLVQQATGNGACFFVPLEMPTTCDSLQTLGVLPQFVIQYPEENDLTAFVQQLAPRLIGVINAEDQIPGILATFPFAQRR